MSVQHVFHGDGSPKDLGIIAPSGSHYINAQDSYEVWLATYSEPADGESPGYTEWVKLLEKWPAVPTIQAVYEIVEAGSDMIMQGNPAELRIIGSLAVFSNVELLENTVSGYRYYSAPGPFRAVTEATLYGGIILTITPLFESLAP